MKGGRKVCVAGVVLVRQRPGKGTAIFVTIEDEGGIANIVLWERQFERFRREVMASRLMLVEGKIQRSREGVIHVMAHRVIDRSDMLGGLSDLDDPNPLLSRADEFTHPQHPRKKSGSPATAQHPRNVRLLPKSRDFR